MADSDDKPEPPAPEPPENDEISDEVLQWISGGAREDAPKHGCPACPHPALGPGFKTGSHILVDGSIFEDGLFKRKL